MAKKQIMARLDFPTVKWLDRQISKGFLYSYNHAIKLGLKLLKKNLHTTIKFKKANVVKNGENEENASYKS